MSFDSGSHLCYGAIVIAIVVTRTHEQWIQLVWKERVRFWISRSESETGD